MLPSPPFSLFHSTLAHFLNFISLHFFSSLFAYPLPRSFFISLSLSFLPSLSQHFPTQWFRLPMERFAWSLAGSLAQWGGVCVCVCGGGGGGFLHLSVAVTHASS